MKCPKCKRICDCATADAPPEPTEEMVELLDEFEEAALAFGRRPDCQTGIDLTKARKALRAALAAAQKEG